MWTEDWIAEGWRLAGLVLLCALAGFLFDHYLFFFLLGAVYYAAKQLIQLRRLERWLGQGKIGLPPDATRVWGEVFNEVFRIQKRSRARRQRLAGLLRRFNESTSAMPDGTIVLDDLGRMEWFNKAACRFFGLRPKTDVGQRVDNLVRAPEFVAYLAGGDFSRPLEISSPLDSTLSLSVTIVPYGHQHRLMVVRDVTRLAQLEKVRRDFVANVSHELRTPLTVVKGYLEVLADDLGQRPSTKTALAQMQMHTERMQRIVEDLLMLSRLETQDRSEVRDQVPVAALLAAIREDAMLLSGTQNHQIELVADRDVWLLGNEKELHSAFSNLVFNAVKYTPADGKITLRWKADAGGPRLEVTDTGIGIAAPHIPRLTERFYRVDTGRSREQGGTGLGLAIVKHVLLRHQGRLEITSQPGIGSTFACLFPRDRQVLRPTPEAVSAL